MPVAGSLMGFAAGDARGGTHGMRGVVSVLVWLCPSGCAPVSATAHCGRYGGSNELWPGGGRATQGNICHLAQMFGVRLSRWGT